MGALLALLTALSITVCGGTTGSPTVVLPTPTPTSSKWPPMATPTPTKSIPSGLPKPPTMPVVPNTPIVPSWDTKPYSASPPGPCDKGKGKWTFTNSGTAGTYSCVDLHLKLTTSTLTLFYGVPPADGLDPDLRISSSP